ncbi:MAG: peptide-methionine (S)-S-oxide reductase MsrA [Opitutae bacterium]|nr:peptide-methionine (S)-S-oxide reductase MsrA [Opitutae bacterium]
MKRFLPSLAALAALFLMTTTPSSAAGANAAGANASGQTETAILGGGCFWCIEAVYEHVPGVKSVVSGYAGGHVTNPTYEQVCTGTTGHAEVAKITFDPAVLSFEKLLEVFFDAHDPTTLNRQGADEGAQYRSVIFYQNEAQQRAAARAKITAQAQWDDPIVTEIVPLKEFYAAENYHQDYFKNHPNQGYCSFVIKPKVKKLQDKGVISKERTVK